jgi:hypothetical protein
MVHHPVIFDFDFLLDLLDIGYNFHEQQRVFHQESILYHYDSMSIFIGAFILFLLFSIISILLIIRLFFHIVRLSLTSLHQLLSMFSMNMVYV